MSLRWHDYEVSPDESSRLNKLRFAALPPEGAARGGQRGNKIAADSGIGYGISFVGPATGGDFTFLAEACLRAG